jgi:hypothetical protein
MLAKKPTCTVSPVEPAHMQCCQCREPRNSCNSKVVGQPLTGGQQCVSHTVQCIRCRHVLQNWVSLCGHVPGAVAVRVQIDNLYPADSSAWCHTQKVHGWPGSCAPLGPAALQQLMQRHCSGVAHQTCMVLLSAAHAFNQYAAQ